MAVFRRLSSVAGFGPGLQGMIKGALVLPLALAFLDGCSSLPDWIAPAQAPATSKSAAPPRQVASVATSVDNPTQDQLMGLPKRQQAAILAEAVGHGCQGVSPYFMGIGDDGSAIWSVRCARGHAWAVSISPGPAGDTTVKRCTSFAAETHLSCFSKF